MSEYILENDFLKVVVEDFGAELISVKNKWTDEEYLWNADPTYWKRHAPVLFPIVGSLKDKKYSYQGREYFMGQHGFARDMQFTLQQKSEDVIVFILESNDETKKVYPFSFRLEIGYRLYGKQVAVDWKVINTGDDEMLFQIGAHPAFICPLKDGEVKSNYFLAFENCKELQVNSIEMNSGLAINETYPLPLEPDLNNFGYLPLNDSLFDKDALIIENKQVSVVKLVKPNKEPYVTVTFDMPILGLWSPAGKRAPFVCIEPWFGRCDSIDASGNLEEKEYVNVLHKEGTFTTSYTMIFQ